MKELTTMGEDRRFAPSWERIKNSQEDDQLKSGKLRRRRCIQCCGCLSALTLVLVLVLAILMFTVFRVKDPTITLNSVTFDKLTVSNTSSPAGLPPFNPMNPLPQITFPTVNMTMIADLSVKNPNIASFKFNNGTTIIYYGGSEIGGARNPSGDARARKTLHMNLTVELSIKPDSSTLGKVQNLMNDISSGSLTVDSYTWIDGRVNALNIFKRYIIVKMNCTMTVILSSTSIKDMQCNEHINGL